MKKSTFLLLLIILIFSTSANALRCGNSIVVKGDSSFKVKKLCGDPAFTDQWEVIHSKTVKNTNSKSRIENTEIQELWTYNFGSSKLVQYLSFINHELVKIESGSHGFNDDKQHNRSKCGIYASVNDLKIDIYRKCGKPTAMLKHPNVIKKNSIGNKITKERFETKQTEETWVYDSVKSRFIYHIRFTNGKVTEIKQE